MWEPGGGGEGQGGCSGQEARDKPKFGGGTWCPGLRMLPGKRGHRCYSRRPSRPSEWSGLLSSEKPLNKPAQRGEMRPEPRSGISNKNVPSKLR